jgi:hypothetical protein
MPTVAVAVIDPSIVAVAVAVTGLVIPAVAVPVADNVTTENVVTDATLEPPREPMRTLMELAAETYPARTPEALETNSNSSTGLSPWYRLGVGAISELFDPVISLLLSKST